jgi:hypothetical protein
VHLLSTAMRTTAAVLTGVAALSCTAHGFVSAPLPASAVLHAHTSLQPQRSSAVHCSRVRRHAVGMMSEVIDAAIDVPANLASECGIDYVPLATMLATGEAARSSD